MVAYTRGNPTSPLIRTVSITSVDPQNQGAYGTGDFAGQVYIDTSYYVGATSVTPSVGDQWHIQQINGQWRLYSRIAFNDPNQAAVIPTQGQHIVGSGQGPVELQGTQVNVSGPLSVASYTSVTLPDPSTVPAGSHVYDTTLGKPVWSNGTNWTDSLGNITITKVAVSLSGKGVLVAPGTTSQFVASGTHTTGQGLLAATIKAKLATPFAGQGALTLTTKHPWYLLPHLAGQGVLAVSGGQLRKPSLSGHGATSGSGTMRYLRSAAPHGAGALAASRSAIPGFAGIDAGFQSTGTVTSGSYTGTVPTTANLAILFLVFECATGVLSGVTPTLGGHSMTEITAGAFGPAGPGRAVSAWYLTNPPAGAQTVSVSISPASYLNFATAYYRNVGSIGATTQFATNNTGSAGLSVSSSSTSDLYANVITTTTNSSPTTIASYNQNTRLNTSAIQFQHLGLYIGDAVGNGGTLSFSGVTDIGGVPGNTYTYSIAIPLVGS